MRDILLLTKVLLNSSKAQVESKGSKFKKIFIVLFAFIYLIGFMGYISYETITDLASFNMEHFYLKTMLMGMFTFFVMQTIIAGLNVLFFSKDIEVLLPLPIKPNKIIMAKMNTLIISEYLTGLLLLAPVLVVYGYSLKLGVTYYLFAIAAFLVLPIIPVIIMSLVVTLIMKTTNIIRNKNVVQYLSIILTIVLVFGVEILSGSTNENVSQQEIADGFANVDAVVEQYSLLYLPVKPIYEMLMNYNNINGILNLAIIFVISGLIYYIGSNIISKIYLKIVTTLNKTGKKKNNKKLTYKIGNAKKAFVSRDFKILLRNPNFMLQCLLLPFLMVTVMVSSASMSFGNITDAEMNFLMEYINEGYSFAIILVLICIFYSFNFISVTSYSRDGQNAKNLKYMPVSFEKQITYKALIGIIMNIILMMIVLIGIKLLISSISVINLLLLFVIATLINFVNNYIGVIIDLKNPKLNWTHEHAVVKQNFNMIIQMALIALQIIAIVYLGNKLQNLEQIVIIVSLVYMSLFVMVKTYIKKSAKKLYSKID